MAAFTGIYVVMLAYGAAFVRRFLDASVYFRLTEMMLDRTPR